MDSSDKSKMKEIAKLDRWLGKIGTTTYLCQDDDGNMKTPSGNVAQIISDIIDRRIAAALYAKEASK